MISDDEFGYIVASKKRIEVLMVLGQLDATTEEICDAICSTYSYISAVARDLTKKGFIEPNNQYRGKLYHLTDKGKETVEKIKTDYYGLEC